MSYENYCVYILTNPSLTVLYIGVTNNLPRRIFEHQEKVIDGFTKKYNCNKLVYNEQSGDVNSAIAREKELKGWKRIKKEFLISVNNPDWKDLSDEVNN